MTQNHGCTTAGKFHNFGQMLPNCSEHQSSFHNYSSRPTNSKVLYWFHKSLCVLASLHTFATPLILKQCYFKWENKYRHFYFNLFSRYTKFWIQNSSFKMSFRHALKRDSINYTFGRCKRWGERHSSLYLFLVILIQLAREQWTRANLGIHPHTSNSELEDVGGKRPELDALS